MVDAAERGDTGKRTMFELALWCQFVYKHCGATSQQVEKCCEKMRLPCAIPPGVFDFLLQENS